MESEVRPSENAAKKNKANDQKKNRTGRKTDSVLFPNSREIARDYF